MKFSILICSLVERKDMLRNLVADLQDQIEENDYEDEVEILAQVDNKENTTGYKRNILLKRATGDYIAFFDDDDEPTPDYIKLIRNAIETNPDVVGIRGVLFFNGAYQGIFEHSIKHKQWINQDKTFVRPPNHLNPVKRELAVAAGFPDKVFGEDMDYSMKLLPLLKTEEMIPTPIYHYMSRNK
jgi:glycosyltransferase involved in cell wall biosynthesis